MNDKLNNKIAYIANYFWKMSIDTINTVLSKDQVGSFNMNDYYYLTVISQLRDPNLGDVAKELKLTKPAISAMVRRLTQNDLVQKVQSADDKRVYHITLTEKGLRIIRGDDALYQSLADNLALILNDEQIYDMDCLLTVLVNQIKERQNEKENG